MALVNPAGLYTGGAVKLDSTPSLNFYAQLMARKQARQDALDQYYRKMMDTTEGQENKMRPQDIIDPSGNRSWKDKFDEFQQFYMNPDNKKAILNPSRYGYDKAMQFEKMHSELLSDARNSTNLATTGKKALDLIMATHQPMLDSDHHEYNQYDKSMYDPSRKIQESQTDPFTGQQFQKERDPDLSNLSVNVPDFTPAQKEQAMKHVAGKPSPDAGTFDSKNLTMTHKFSFSPDQVKSVAANYGTTLAGDPVAMKHYERLMESQYYPALNEVYHKYFGKNIENPVETATAEAALEAETSPKYNYSETKPWSGGQAEFNRREGIKQADRLQLQRKSQGFQSWLKGQPTYGQKEANSEEGLSAMSALHETKAALFNNKDVNANPLWWGDEMDMNDPTILSQFKGTGVYSNKSPNSAVYKQSDNKIYLIFKDPTTGEETERQPLDPKSYIRIKVGQTYKGAQAGKLNNMVDKFYEDHGSNLIKTLQALDKPPAAATKMITVKLKDGRTGQIPEDKVSQFLKENQGSKRQ